VVPSYHALSYAWGDASRKVLIFLNCKPFLVTTNLEAALRARRCSCFLDSLEQSPLWVDAICIDQENAFERNQQVQRMKDTYANAETTVIWLGNYNEEGDAQVLQSAHALFDGVGPTEGTRENTEAVFEIVMFWATHGEALEHSTLDSPVIERFFKTSPGNNLQAWRQLYKLLRRPWFDRLWVVQELQLSQKSCRCLWSA
jgi:Heterokaryon incompatibility protein (HET)